MKPPSDQGILESGYAANPRAARSETWILAAAILGSSMAFIDSTVVYVAQVRAAAERLVLGRYLLQDDADRLIAQADASRVLK